MLRGFRNKNQEEPLATMGPRGQEMPHTHPLERSRPHSRGPQTLSPDSAPTRPTEKPQGKDGFSHD